MINSWLLEAVTKSIDLFRKNAVLEADKSHKFVYGVAVPYLLWPEGIVWSHMKDCC